MKKITFVLVLSALAVSACSESSNDDNHQCNPETESCDTGDITQCTNDAWKCDGNTLSKCVSGKWEISQTCAANTLCNTQTGSCVSNGIPQCTNDTWKCDGNTLFKCVSGNWEISQACAANTLCNAKKGLCEPNASECRDTEHFFADKCEADDLTHCGTHTNDCTRNKGWKNGRCIAKFCFAEECEPGYHLSSLFDSDNIERTSCTEDTHDACGSVNTKCDKEEICTQGECKDKCQPGEVICGGSCINPMTSRNFCGADVSCSSYIPCSEFEKCIDGKCVLSSCQNAEESLCTSDDQTICVNIHGNHPNHCGECGTVCTDKGIAKTTGCNQGQCIYTCKDNMVNCGSDTEPTCLSKDQLKSDPLHCGKCDTKCAENAYCQDGQCIISSCPGNECLFDNACINQNDHCGTQCLNCNTSNLASAGVCQQGTCIITSCIAGYHLTNKGACEKDSAEACPNGNATDSVNCNTLEYTKAGICEEGKCKATECQDNAHIKDNKCVADTIESCGSEDNDCTRLAGWKAGTCENGKCIATTCQSGFCLNSLSGQCTNTQNNSTCGIDGGACQSCTIKQICSAGICEAKQCEGNVCKQPTGADEEDLCQNDDAHCGSECMDCTKISNAAASTCNITEGICQVTDCETGYHIYNNACEADSTSNCGEHDKQCNVANANNECINKACTFTCNSDYHPYNEACEPDDENNCGAHSKNCFAVIPGYASGACVEKECRANTCLDGYHLDSANNRCVMDTSDCCGTSCTSCPSYNVCSKGVCETHCEAPLSECNNECHNYANDINHCGGCNQACTTALVSYSTNVSCSDSICKAISCQSDYHVYDGDCEQDNLENCGAHGTKCNVANAENTCTNGKCTFTCAPGYHTSNHACSDAQLTLTPSSLEIYEGGKGTFTIVPAVQPYSTVTVTLSVTDPSQASLAETSYTFGTSDWKTPQTVTVTGLRDDLADGDRNIEIKFNVVSSDERYDGLQTDPLSVTVIDTEADTSLYNGSTSLSFRAMAANLSSGNYQSYYQGEGVRIIKALKPDIVMIQEFNWNRGGESDADAMTLVQQAFDSSFYVHRGRGNIPNGIISRYPIIDSGSWVSNMVNNRTWDWAVIDLPGKKELLVISVHLSIDNNTKEAPVLMNTLGEKIIADKTNHLEYYLMIGGDFNNNYKNNPYLNTYFSVSNSLPVDQNGTEGTNASRKKVYDHVFVDSAFNSYEVPVVIGTHSYPNGHVFDSRVYDSHDELGDVPPVKANDSGAANMQHMAVIRDFVFHN